MWADPSAMQRHGYQVGNFVGDRLGDELRVVFRQQLGIVADNRRA